MEDENLDDLFGFDDDGDGNNKDDSIILQKLFNAKRGIIFLVDCHEYMFQDKGYGIPFLFAMRTIGLCLRQRVIQAPGSYGGIFFYGCEKSKNTLSANNVVEYQSLGKLDVTKLNEVKDYVEYMQSAKIELPSIAGAPGAINTAYSALERSLFLCMDRFKEAKLKYGEDDLKIWIMSTNDKPHENNETLYGQLHRKFQDIFENDIDLEIWTFGAPFDESNFYDKVRPEKSFNGKVNTQSFVSAMNDLVDYIRKRDFGKRKVAPLIMNMGNGLRIGLDLFPKFLAMGVPSKVLLDAKTLDVVKSEILSISRVTGRVITPDSYTRKLCFGLDGKITVTKDDVVMVKSFGDPGFLTFIGFKSFDNAIKLWYTKRPAYLVMPSEAKVQGSTTFTHALIQTMVKKNQVLLASLILRKGEPVKLVALIPQLESVDEDGEVIDPAGFNLVVLPWAHDIRPWNKAVEIQSQQPADENSIDAACAMIDSMSLRLSSDQDQFILYQNPHIQKHYRCVEDVALMAETDPATYDNDPNIDETLIDLDQSKLEAIERFCKSYGGREDATEAKDIDKAAGKRSAASKSSEPKRAKLDETNWRDLHASGNLKKLTIADLQKICTELELARSGKKQEIIDRIEEHLAAETAPMTSLNI